MAELTWRWRGRMPYATAWAEQRAERARIRAGAAPGQLWLLEHDPTITLGRRGGTVDEAAARADGYAIFATERGGLATCHEPGQLVGYLLLDISRVGVRRTVEVLEAAIGGWLRERGVDAVSRAGFPGVWAGRRKLCAVGLHVERGVTMHGLALNLRNDLRGFGHIVPCGILDGSPGRLADLDPACPTPADAAASVARSVLDAFGALR